MSTENDCLEALTAAIDRRRALLFVGAGASMSVGLPSWNTLVSHMLEELELDPQVLSGNDVTYQSVAECYRLKCGSLKPLLQWMQEHWAVSREQVAASPLHKLIVELGFPTIYTTNYDRNLEIAFEVFNRPYKKITSVGDIAEAESSATLIIKYHGDFDDETSLVLAETDYFDRLTFEAPLDVKFRSDALASTILFIGYSMSDLNIRFLLHRLWSSWRRSGDESHRPPSYIFMYRPNPVQAAVLDRWGVTMMTGEGDTPEEALMGFLTKLKSRACRPPE